MTIPEPQAFPSLGDISLLEVMDHVKATWNSRLIMDRRINLDPCVLQRRNDSSYWKMVDKDLLHSLFTELHENKLVPLYIVGPAIERIDEQEHKVIFRVMALVIPMMPVSDGASKEDM